MTWKGQRMAARSDKSRFARRQWGRRLRAALPWLLTGLGVGALALAVWAVFFSSWLATQRVDVSGATIVSDDDVVQAADVNLGTPLARVNLDAVRDRIEALPAVADVSVHRSWPHTLDISVTERTPLATVPQHGRWLAMDKDGVLFRPTSARDETLPVVVLAPAAVASARREVASVVDSLPSNLLSTTRRIKARSMDSITLTLTDGREIKWGSADDTDRKVEVLAILLGQHASVYDVSVPEQPTTSR